LTKMLVALGQTSRGDTDSVELIDLDSATGNDICEKFPDFPVVTKSPGIELDFQGNPIICGGGTPSRCQFHQHFRNSFCKRRSRKCKKRLTTWLSFFTSLGSACITAAHKKLMKLSTYRCQFYQHFRNSFFECRSQKRKKDWQLDCLFLQ